jgi:inner membrane protein
MDTTTHALTGYVIAQAGLNKGMGKWGTIAGVTASIFPDVDLLLGIFGSEFALKYHRGLTNSVFLIIPFSLLLAWLFIKISGIGKYWRFFVICVVVIAAHDFLDLATSYGTMILSPFSDYRFKLDWLFIVDPYFVAALLFPLIVSFFWNQKRIILGRISLVIAAAYIGLCAYNHSQAVSLAKGFAQEKRLTPIAIASLPQPLSPFNWANYLLTDESIYRGFVNLIASEDQNPGKEKNFLSRFLARYRPIRLVQYQEIHRFDDSPWVEKALELEEARTFFWFARFPIVRDRGFVDGNRRVEFFDLRFGSINKRRPFVYAVDYDEAGRVVFQGFL